MTSSLSYALEKGKELGFSVTEVNRLQQLEFVHQIGLVPILRMGGGENEEENGETPPSGSVSPCNVGGGNTLINPSDSSEDGNTSNDGSIGNDSSHPGEQDRNEYPPVTQQEKPTYDELLAENEELKRLLESNKAQLLGIERNHEVVLDENNLITMELEDVQREATAQKLKLEQELLLSQRQQEVLQKRATTLRNGLQEMTGVLMDLITQLSNNRNGGQPLMITPPEGNQETVRQLSITPPVSSTSAATAFQTPTCPSATNLLQMVLERMPPKMITAGPPVETPPQATTSKNCGGYQIAKAANEDATLTPRRSKRNLSGPTPQEISPTSSKKEGKIKKSGQDAVAGHAVDTSREHEGFFCLCGTSCTTKLGLSQHIQYRTSEGQFPCSVQECGKRFFSTSILKAHMKAKHGLVYLGENGCRKCGETFSSRMELYVHCKYVHNCGPLLSHKKRKKSPKRKHTKKLKAFSGSKRKTDVGPRQRKKLASHEMDTSNGPDNWSCVCGSDFHSRHNLQMHINYFTGERRFPCQVCGNRFNGTNLLRQHMKAKHNMGFQGYGCRRCGLIFQTLMELFQHCQISHKIGPLYRRKARPQTAKARTPAVSRRQRKAPVKYVPESESYFAPPSKMNKEPSSGHAADPNCFFGTTCLCGNGYKSRQALLQHIKSTTKAKTLKCSFCPKRFRRRDSMKKHIISDHTSNVDPSKKTVTPKKRPGTQVEPRNDLSDILPSTVSPSACHGVATSNQNTGQFECLCGSQFPRKDLLREHIKLTLGLTQYNCDFCPETFWRQDYLKLHLQRVHCVVSTGYA